MGLKWVASEANFCLWVRIALEGKYLFTNSRGAFADLSGSNYVVELTLCIQPKELKSLLIL